MQRLRDQLFPSKLPLKEKLSIAIYKLQTSMDRLKNISIGLKTRDQKYFNRCIEAQLNKDQFRAIIYANECAEVRKLAQLVISSELAIEQSVLRLQTVSELSEVMLAVGPIVEIVQETKGKLAGIIPSVANKLDEVNTVLKTSLREMSATSMQSETIREPNEEALNVLRQANEAAEEKVRQRFPELPTEMETNEKLVPVALTASGDESQSDQITIKNRVYDYMKDCKGRINTVQCASFLGVFPDDVEEAIRQLKEEGRIALK